MARTRLRENSALLYECNELRREVKYLERSLDMSEGERQDMMRVMESMKQQIEVAGMGKLCRNRVWCSVGCCGVVYCE